MSCVVRVAGDPIFGMYWAQGMKEINLVCGWVITPWG